MSNKNVSKLMEEIENNLNELKKRYEKMNDMDKAKYENFMYMIKDMYF